MHAREFDEPSGAHSGGPADQSSPDPRPTLLSFGVDSTSSSLQLDESVDHGLALIVEEITRRSQAGEEIDLEDYGSRYPQWASVLQSLLSPLRALAHFGHAAIPSPSSEPRSASAVLPPTFGDFIVRGEVGRGGMGIVYEAEQVSLGRRVALKILSAAAALDSQSSRRFQVEAQAAACLNHANIIPVYAVGSHDDVPFYAMQFVEGASLAEVVLALRLLRDGTPEPADARVGRLAEPLALDLLADGFGLAGTGPGSVARPPDRRLRPRRRPPGRAGGRGPGPRRTSRGSSIATSSRRT